MIPLSTDPLKSLQRWCRLIGAASILVLAGGICLYITSLQHKVADLEAVKPVLTGDAKAATTYSTEHKVLVAREKRTDARVDAALKANPDWSVGVLPADVASVLCHDPAAACAVPQGLPDH